MCTLNTQEQGVRLEPSLQAHTEHPPPAVSPLSQWKASGRVRHEDLPAGRAGLVGPACQVEGRAGKDGETTRTVQVSCNINTD